MPVIVRKLGEDSVVERLLSQLLVYLLRRRLVAAQDEQFATGRPGQRDGRVEVVSRTCSGHHDRVQRQPRVVPAQLCLVDEGAMRPELSGALRRSVVGGRHVAEASGHWYSTTPSLLKSGVMPRFLITG